MKICLLELPMFVSTFSRPEYIDYPGTPFLFPNISMGYIGAILEHQRYKVDILECPGLGINSKSLYEIIEREHYDIICLSTYYFDYGIALVSISRTLNAIRKRCPSAYIVAGGYLASLNADLLINSVENIDCCVVGEAELTFPDLVKAIKEKRDLSQVNGIAYKQDGKIIKTAPRRYIEDLDSLPYPRRAFIGQDLKGIELMTSRGCYGNCIFCLEKEVWRKNECLTDRHRKVENVVEEIEFLKKNYRFQSIYIFDSNFMGSSPERQEWLQKFCVLMKEKGLRIPFRIETRVTDIIANKSIMGSLREVGLWRIFIGIESFLQRQLDFFQKGTTVAQNIEALEICRDVGVKPEYGFLMLEPMVTMDEILENVRTIKRIKLYEYSYPCQELLSTSSRRLFAPPGVRANSFIEENGIKADNYFCYDFLNKEIELYFDITKIWERGFREYYPLYYLYNKVLDETTEESKILARLNVTIKRMDLELVEDLALKIKEKEITRAEDANGLLETWGKRMREAFAAYYPIKQRVDQLEKELTKY